MSEVCGQSACHGYTLLREMEEQRKTTLAKRMPAIALSGNAEEDDRLRALLAGFQVYLGKPMEASELVASNVAITRA